MWPSLLICSALAGCGGRRAPVTTEPTTSASASAAPAESFLRAAEIPELRLVSRVRSAHPSGDFVARVLVDRAAESYGRRGRPAFPEGALIAEQLGPSEDGPPSLVYVMERGAPGSYPEGGDWSYGVLGADGTVQAFGKLPLCARCHAEAPSDHVFERIAGVPGPSTPQP